jgi:DNA-binding NarL/FixJ family response regulator
MRKITVLIADDHTIVRQGLKHLLQMAPDIEVVGEADNGEAAVRQAKALQPNVVVLDIAMPAKNGIDAARQIGKQTPSARILILSTYHEDQEVQQAVDAGVAGFMMKESAGAELLNAVREIAKGNSFFSPPIARRMLRQTRNAYQTKADKSPLDQKLTARELEVLKLIAEGKPNKGTADVLGISIKTVEKHRQSLMDKLHIHEAATLTRYAISKGIVPCVRPSLVPMEAAAAPGPGATASA